MEVPNSAKEKPSKDLGKLSREKEERWPMSQGGKHLVAFERINKASVATEEGLKEEVKPEFKKICKSFRCVLGNSEVEEGPDCLGYCVGMRRASG